MERAIEVFAAINFMIIGVSHVCQHRAWADFFARLQGLGNPGAFANGFLSLFMGSLIVALHNVWSWPGVLLTAIGYAMLTKAAIVFVRPDWGLASMARVTPDESRKIIVPGVFFIVLATTLAYSVWQG
ncbi:MAG: hypothetical protein E4H28_01870 [Gemmatimonadales bacterium]|nr:MAG: hypothetical protein E4H28_01870 [Gemmatimonadales bacterium]